MLGLILVEEGELSAIEILNHWQSKDLIDKQPFFIILVALCAYSPFLWVPMQFEV